MDACTNCKSKDIKLITKIFNWNNQYNTVLNSISKKYKCNECDNIFIMEDNNKTLFKEEWLSIKLNNGYSYLHEEKANGTLIAFLPYQIINNRKLYLMRMEICPAHGNEHEFCGIIGSMDNLSLSIEQTAIKELKEEAGYNITEEQLIPLGWVWDSKVADTKVYLFTADLTNISQGISTTDGTELEKTAYCVWTDMKKCIETNDSKVHTILNKMTLGEI